MKRTTSRLWDTSLCRMFIQRLALVLAGTCIALLAGEICFRLVPFERFKYEARYGHFSGNAVAVHEQCPVHDEQCLHVSRGDELCNRRRRNCGKPFRQAFSL